MHMYPLYFWGSIAQYSLLVEVLLWPNFDAMLNEFSIFDDTQQAGFSNAAPIFLQIDFVKEIPFVLASTMILNALPSSEKCCRTNGTLDTELGYD